MKTIGIVLGIMMVVAMGAPPSARAQSLTTIFTFCTATNANGSCIDGTFPEGMAEISPGLFLGATDGGGVSNGGTAFLLTSEGTLTTIYQFDNQSGTEPNGCFQSIDGMLVPVQANDGSLFGTTKQGGTGGSGTVARITSEGTLTEVYQFSGPDGSQPRNLILGGDGNYYGYTWYGGTGGSGTVFRLTSAGTLTTLHSFSGPDGALPNFSIQSSIDNQFYGATGIGGTNNNGGTVFKMTTSGTLTTMHSFNRATEGIYPILTLQNGDNFYGSLSFGGINGSGTVFRITSAGVLTNLYYFGGADGAIPVVTYMDSDGSLYGVTESGGPKGNGTVFKLTSAGTLTTLYAFCSDPGCSDGSNPSQLNLGSDGKFYGMSGGGFTNLNGNGTAFILDAGVIIGTCTYLLNPSNAVFNAIGGTGTFNVISSNTCPWSATNNVNFITITAGTPGTGNGTIQYTVAANMSGSSRTGTVTAAGKTFIVIESAVSCTVAPATTSAQFSAAGGSSNVTVTATATNCGWSAVSNDSFIQINSGSSGTGTGTVQYTVAANTNTEIQTGTMTIAGQTFTVTEAGVPCVTAPATTSAQFGSSGGSSTVAVNANGTNCTWTAGSNNGFIQITSGSSGVGPGTVLYTVAANPNAEIQTGTMTIAGQTFTITEAAAPCVTAPATTSAQFGSSGGSSTVTVDANGTNCAWTATTTNGFIQITSGSSGFGPGTVHYTVAANASTNSLTGTMTIAGQTFTVTEAGAAAAGCTFSLSATNRILTAKGGAKSVNVKASSATCDWTAFSNDSFITITSGASGSGKGKVEYTVPGNTNTTALTGTMTIAGETYTVNQLAGGCKYRLSPKHGKVKSTGGTETIKVTPNLSDCEWTAVSNDGFITLTGGTNSTGKGTVAYTVPANMTANVLTGSITVAGQTFTVIQAGVK